MRDRVRLDLERDHIGVWPDRQSAEASGRGSRPDRDPLPRGIRARRMPPTGASRRSSERGVRPCRGRDPAFGAGDTAVHALRAVDLVVAEGSTSRSRAGPARKTTLLNLIGGLDRPTAGRIVVGDAEVTAMSDDDPAAAAAGDGLPCLPVLRAHPDPHGAGERLGSVAAQQGRARERDERVAAVLRASASPRTSTSCRASSGGQQQRVGLARALAARPRLLLADEPTGQLDSPHRAREIMTLIGAPVRRERMTAIVTTHDPLLLSLADRVVEIADGRIGRDGPDRSSGEQVQRPVSADAGGGDGEVVTGVAIGVLDRGETGQEVAHGILRGDADAAVQLDGLPARHAGRPCPSTP